MTERVALGLPIQPFIDGTLEVTAAERKAGRLSAKLDALTVVRPRRRVEFAFSSMIQEERLTNFVTVNLSGVMTFGWDGESAGT